MTTLARSVALGKTAEDRPAFTHTYNKETGEIIVNITQGTPSKVALRYAKTH